MVEIGHAARTKRGHIFDFVAAILSVIVVVVCLFLPLILVALYRPGDVPLSAAKLGGATVGIAVILRATARRLFRTAARAASAMRTTFSTLSRASARTFTRRFVRIVMHSVFGVVTRQAASGPELDDSGEPELDDSEEAEAAPVSWLSSCIALVVSFATLGLSFWGVLHLVGPAKAAAMTTEQGLSVTGECCLAATPILAYASVIWLAGRSMGLQVRFAAGLDALLLQGYFTGAGSFLPMTTDFEYDGTRAQRARLAGITLGTMFVVHVVLFVSSMLLESYSLRFTSTMFIVYCFVYAFPLRPLEGYDLWKFSKAWWCCLFIPVFLAFIYVFPEEMASIL